MIEASFKGVRSSRGMAKRLHGCGLLGPQGELTDVDEVHLNLSDFEHLELEDFAYLVALTRQLAERSARVTVSLPLSTPTLLSKRRLLERLGFTDAFATLPPAIQSRITFVHDTLAPATGHGAPPAPPGRSGSRYIPFTFVDHTWFEPFGRTPENPIGWLALRPEKSDLLEGLLRRRGYLDPAGTRIFVDTMFGEIAANSVHHAFPGESGWSVYCVHLKPRTPTSPEDVLDLSFAIADVGVGIPATLSEAYRRWRSGKEQLPGNLHTRLLRFALDQEGSRRTFAPDGLDPRADELRGLTAVAEATALWGSLALRSARGALDLEGREAIPSTRMEGNPLSGVQVRCTLRHRSTREQLWSTYGTTDWTQEAVCLPLCDAAGRWLPIGDPQGMVRHLDIHRSSHFIILDCGFAPGRSTELVAWIREAFHHFRDGTLIAWNVSQEWSDLKTLGSWLTSEMRGNSRPVLVVRGPADVGLIGSRDQRTDQEYFETVLGITIRPPEENGRGFYREARLPATTYFTLDHLVNSSFVRAGFASASEEAGFFAGAIHLMSGQPVKRFFSMTRNTDISTSNSRRWATSASAWLATWLGARSEPEGRVVLLGLGYSTRRLLPLIAQHLPESPGMVGYVLLSYDAPSRQDLEAITQEGDLVYLLTDVMSSGSAVDTTIDALDATGATLSGIIACLHAADSRRAWGDIRFACTGEIEPGRPEPAAVDYWVDAISMVPSRERLWSEAIDARIDTAIELIAHARSTRVGHFADGVRHTALHVDLLDILQTHQHAIRPLVAQALTDALDSVEWRDFMPQTVLVPAGIGRVELVLGDEPERVVTAYPTAVMDLLPAIRSHWPSLPEPTEVPRAFDPDGRPRVAASIGGLELAGKHVLIVDDAMASGRTATGLAQIAARAGAAQVVTIALLARLGYRDAAFWEQVSQIRSKNGEVPFRAVFPLILPVPYHTAPESAVEATRLKLGRWARRGDALGEIAREIDSELKARHPSDTAPQDPAFVATWVKCLGLAYIAGESQDAVERLSAFLEEVSRSGSHEAQRAVSEVFLREWRFLSQPRLRQVLKPRLLEQVNKWLDTPALPTDLAVSLVALLRSFYPPAFLGYLAQLSDRADASLRLLERSLFHAHTFAARRGYSSDLQQFARIVLDRHLNVLAAQVENEADERRVHRIQELASELGRARSPEATWGTVQALEAIRDYYRSQPYNHEHRKTFEVMARQLESPPGSVPRLSSDALREDWQRAVIDIRTLLVPALLTLEDVIRLREDCRLSLPDDALQYLLPLTEGQPAGLMRDMDSLVTYLGMHASGSSMSEMRARVVGTALGNMREHVIGGPTAKASADQLLALLTCLEVQESAQLLERKLSELTIALPGAIVTSNHASLPRGRQLVMTIGLWEKTADGLLSNLLTKAFADLPAGPSPQVYLEWEYSSNGRRVTMRMFDNGARTTRQFRLGGTLDLLRRPFEALGGTVRGVIPTESHPWQNVTTFDLSTIAIPRR